MNVSNILVTFVLSIWAGHTGSPRSYLEPVYLSQSLAISSPRPLSRSIVYLEPFPSVNHIESIFWEMSSVFYKSFKIILS